VLRLMLEAGLSVSAGTGSDAFQFGGALAAGVRVEGSRPSLQHPTWALEIHAVLRPNAPVRAVTAIGSVDLDDLRAGGGLRALWVRPRFSVGGHVELSARILGAHARAAGGQTGDGQQVARSLVIGPELRWRPWSGAGGSRQGPFELRLAAGPEVTAPLEIFSIFGQPVAQVGGVHFLAQLSLVALLP
jgi:hypothetical protein